MAVAFGLLAIFKEKFWGRVCGVLAFLGGVAVAAIGYTGPSEPTAARPTTSSDEADPAESDPGNPSIIPSPETATQEGEGSSTHAADPESDSASEAPAAADESDNGQTAE